jgi:hypothetical protein
MVPPPVSGLMQRLDYRVLLKVCETGTFWSQTSFVFCLSAFFLVSRSMRDRRKARQRMATLSELAAQCHVARSTELFVSDVKKSSGE